MHVGALAIDLHVPSARSLKDKRAVVKPIVEGVRHRFGVSAAEVDHANQWQRSELGFAAVSGSPSQVTEVLDNVERFVWSFPEVEVIEARRSWLDGSDE